MLPAQAFRDWDLDALSLSGARVLAVSSDDLLASRIARATRAAGGSMTAVHAVEEAIALLRIGYRPGLLLVDEELAAMERRALELAVLGSAPPGAVTMVTLASRAGDP